MTRPVYIWVAAPGKPAHLFLWTKQGKSSQTLCGVPRNAGREAAGGVIDCHDCLRLLSDARTHEPTHTDTGETR